MQKSPFGLHFGLPTKLPTAQLTMPPHKWHKFSKESIFRSPSLRLTLNSALCMELQVQADCARLTRDTETRNRRVGLDLASGFRALEQCAVWGKSVASVCTNAPL